MTMNDNMHPSWIWFEQVTTSYMKKVSSYVMQDDQLFPMLTVFETFMFAAEVRLSPSISKSEKKRRVWELLDQLGLQVDQSTLSYYFNSFPTSSLSTLYLFRNL